MLLFDVGTLLTAVVAIVIVYVVVLWLALAFYVVRDARRRTTRPASRSSRCCSASCRHSSAP